MDALCLIVEISSFVLLTPYCSLFSLFDTSLDENHSSSSVGETISFVFLFG